MSRFPVTIKFRLATLRSFKGYEDAMPVEVFDPENGANKFGDGNFVYTSPETGQLTLFDEDGGGKVKSPKKMMRGGKTGARKTRK